MTPERAKEIIKRINFLNTNMIKGKEPPYEKMTKAEELEVINVWRTLDGQCSFMCALWRIAKGERSCQE